MSAEPPTTSGELRRRARDLADSVLAVVESGGSAGDARRHVPERELAGRPGFFLDFRASVRALAASPALRAHDLSTDLLLLTERLRDEIDADLDGADAEWQIREVLTRIVGVLDAMIRRLDDDELDDPEVAFRFVLQRLARADIGRVATLLGVSPQMVHDYREGDVGALRGSPPRVVLVARLTNSALVGGGRVM